MKFLEVSMTDYTWWWLTLWALMQYLLRSGLEFSFWTMM